MRRAVFLDRDGVLNKLVPDPRSGLPESPLRAEDITLIDGVPDALSALRGAGYLLVGVSNQPAAAKGVTSVEELQSVQARLVELLARAGVAFDRFALCFHHPEGSVPELTKTCGCRKPAPGLLTDALRDLSLDPEASWMIGDTDSDIAAGEAAGVRTILIANPASAHKRGPSPATTTVVDLRAATDLILRDTG
jgi:D-glycero-D-manno-heptose 1,7-bisphosphate phosphatase